MRSRPEFIICVVLIGLLVIVTGGIMGQTLVDNAEKIKALETQINDLKQWSERQNSSRRYHVFRINDIQRRSIELAVRVKVLEEQSSQNKRAPMPAPSVCSSVRCVK